MDATINPYLEGNFAPVTEEVTETMLSVEGSIPENLDGRYLRIGPNPISRDPATYHWFTGTGMVHGLRLRDGNAEWYRNRFVRSPSTFRELGEEVKPSKVPDHGFEFSPNTHVIGHGGRTYALVEAGPRPYELTSELETIGASDFDGTLPGGYTAHPLKDPSTEELHAVSYYFGWGNLVQYSVLDADGRIRKTVDIEVGGSPMMHAFSLTENHVVIYDLPVTFDIEKVETLPYSWNSEYPARVGVMPREGTPTDIRWFDVEPCYVYHPFNAYEENGSIVLDVTRHPKMFATDHRGPSEGAPTFDRWTVDLTAGKVIEERLDDRGQEFPRIDERLVGSRHRFGYALSLQDASRGVGPATALIKHDVSAATSQVHSFGEDHEASEFVFVPSSPESAEDDGVLMGFVHDRIVDKSDLVLLDAQTLETVASVHLPVRVPQGFHGSWVPTPG